MNEFFLTIWNNRDHYSEVSQKPLGEEPFTYYFDHLLEKEVYPEVKFETWNIALVTKDEHERKGNGYPDKKHKELIEKARERYDTWKENSIKMDREGK